MMTGASESFTDWTLVSLSPWSAAVTIALALAVLVGAVLVVLSYRGVKRGWALMTVRLLGALLILGFVTEPALQLRVVRKIKNRLAVVLDRSRSMSLQGPGGATRYDAVLKQLEGERDELKKLSEQHIVDWFDLEGPLSPAALKSPPMAETSDLVTALEKAREAGGGKPLAGVVLISDGADSASLEGARRGELGGEAVERLKRLGVPVNTVLAGGGHDFKDLVVSDVVTDEFAFVHNTIDIDVTLEDVGLGSVTVPLTLKRDGEVVATETVALEPGQPHHVPLKVKPDKIGEFVYTVEVPVLAGEAIPDNNVRSFVLSVIRDKIRVLQVAGRPSWDERFLRQHLKENPNVDLISFFILRTPTDQPNAPENELSLIPFPVEKLFTTELRSFDVVVFQDFDFRPYKMAQYLPNIRDAVEQAGLGFVMVGGDGSFGGGGYQGTEIDELLPLRPEPGEMVDGAVTPTLTEAGRAHPVTDLSRGAGKNDLLWKQLGGFASVNRTGGLTEGATALVVAPSVSGSDGKPAPLVAVMDAGQGRTMAIATDTMWRWRFAKGETSGASERAYHRFWSNALRWLVRDPEHSRVRVTPDKRRFDLGEPIDVAFTVLGQDYQPVTAAHLRTTVERAGSGSVKADELTTGDTGIARKRYESLEPGAYRVRAQATASGQTLGEGQAVFVVQSRSAELSRGAPRPDLLNGIAEVTGGRAHDADAGLFAKLELVDPDVVEVDRRRNVELWDNGWALAAGVVLLAIDWALRRRRGYL